MIAVRVMEPGDLADVVAIEATVSPEPWSRRLFEGEFEVDPSSRHWLVAEIDGRIVGFAGMMYVGLRIDGFEGHLMNVATAPDVQRRGVARALCRRLFADGAAVGVDAITLEVRVSNSSAIALYRSFGFAPVGNRASYYTNPDGTTEDGLIFWLHDNVARSAAAEQLSSEERG